MNKQTKILLLVAGVAVAGYFVWKWWQNRQANGNTSPTGSLGTNLNSVAPELVGGSSGPDVGPAVAMPLNITLQETVARPEDDSNMEPDHHHSNHPHHRQRHSAALVQPGGEMTGPDSDSDDNSGGSDVSGAGDLTGDSGDNVGVPAGLKPNGMASGNGGY